MCTCIKMYSHVANVQNSNSTDEFLIWLENASVRMSRFSQNYECTKAKESGFQERVLIRLFCVLIVVTISSIERDLIFPPIIYNRKKTIISDVRNN